MTRKRMRISSVWSQNVNPRVTGSEGAGVSPVFPSWFVILHPISAVACRFAISVPFCVIVRVIASTHVVIFFHTLIMWSSPFCENDRLYNKRNVSFPIFVHCHHSFIKWVHKNSRYQDGAKCGVIMISGHFALKQIMHNKAEFVITADCYVLTSQRSGSREVIELWLKRSRRAAGLVRTQRARGNISAWGLTHNCADTLYRLARFVRPIETRLKMACHN